MLRHLAAETTSAPEENHVKTREPFELGEKSETNDELSVADTNFK